MASFFNTTIPLDELPSPLILLSPHQVHNILIATYIHLGTFAILVWDVINNLRNDWRLVSSFRLSIATPVYFTTRISLMAYAIGRALLLTQPIGSCARLQNALNWLLIIFTASTAFLFYLRVCALYAFQRAIMVAFGACWALAAGMAGTFASTFSAEHIKNTAYCMERPPGVLLGPALAMQFVNEAFLYYAVAHKAYELFAMDCNAQDPPPPWGTSLTAIARFAALEPHMYCLSIVVTRAFLVCAVYSFAAPINSMFLISHLVLTNVWSGRMYRKLRRAGREMEEAPMLTQTEFELRIGSTRAQPTLTRGERTYPPELDSAQTQDILLDNQNKQTSASIYSVRRELKT